MFAYIKRLKLPLSKLGGTGPRTGVTPRVRWVTVAILGAYSTQDWCQHDSPHKRHG